MNIHNRRRFFQSSLWGFLALPLITMTRATRTLAALAQSCPQGPPASEKIARRLINDRNKKRVDYYAHWVDAKDHEDFTEGANCDNCSFYKPDKKEPTFGKCTMAAMQYVPSCGWCKQYKPRKAKTT